MKRYVVDARVATHHFPGIGRYVRNLITALPPYLNANEQLTIICGDEWQPENIDTIQTPLSPFSLKQQVTIPRLLKQLNTAVYHSPYYLMSYRPGVPTLVTIYDMIALVYPQYASWRAKRLFGVATRLALHTADHITTISYATEQDLYRFYRYPVTKVTTIPLAADPIFTPQSLDVCAQINQELRLPDQYALYVGSNKPHKNLHRLIEAWKQCQPTPFPLVIGGAWIEAHAGTIKQDAAELIENGQIRFIGRIDDANLPALYSGAHFFVFPSEYEGFGLPPLEAMACGTPVISSNRSSLPEVVERAAIQVDPEDIDAMANALQLLLSDTELRKKMGEQSLQQAKKFSWSETARQTVNLYRKLAQ